VMPDLVVTSWAAATKAVTRTNRPQRDIQSRFDNQGFWKG